MEGCNYKKILNSWNILAESKVSEKVQAAGIIAVAEDTGDILLALRSEYVDEPGTWGTIGGKVTEGDGSLGLGAQREFYEETGYMGPMKLIPVYNYSSNNFEYQNFIGFVPNKITSFVKNWENKQLKWMTYEQLLKVGPKHSGLALLLSDNNTLEKIKKYSSN